MFNLALFVQRIWINRRPLCFLVCRRSTWTLHAIGSWLTICYTISFDWVSYWHWCDVSKYRYDRFERWLPSLDCGGFLLSFAFAVRSHDAECSIARHIQHSIAGVWMYFCFEPIRFFAFGIVFRWISYLLASLTSLVFTAVFCGPDPSPFISVWFLIGSCRR